MIATIVENILVVKLGGGEGLDMDAACDDLASIAANRPLVIVHGVSALANQLCAEAGIPVRTITSPSGHTSRYTDPQTREIYVRAAEQLNHELVEGLRARGLQAAGLVGSNSIIQGERKEAVRAVVDGRVRIIRDDYSGSINGVEAGHLLHLLQSGVVPVIPPMALSDTDGLLNVDGDRAAAAVARSLGAQELIILSNVRGLYRNFGDENSFVQHVAATQITNALGWAQGRMKRKVIGAQEALEGGVRRVIIGDGRVSNPVQNALQGEGTVFA
jgi:[amino group carrier protein]-L-2-aminoadipate 6-kinase